MIGLFNYLAHGSKVSPQEKLWFWLKHIQTYNFELRYEHSHAGQVHEWSEVPDSYPYESILVFENYPVDSTILQSSVTIDIRDARSIGAQTKHPYPSGIC